MNNWVTNPQINAIIKATLVSVGTSMLVNKGYISAGQLDQVIGGLMVLGAVGWAIFAARPTGLIKSTEKLDNVAQIVVTDKATSDATGPKVMDVATAQVSPLMAVPTEMGEPDLTRRSDGGIGLDPEYPEATLKARQTIDPGGVRPTPPIPPRPGSKGRGL